MLYINSLKNESINRRASLKRMGLASVAVFAGVGCAGRGTVLDPADDSATDRSTEPLTGLLLDATGRRQLAGIALVVERGGRRLLELALGDAGGLAASEPRGSARPLTVQSKLRVASVSKLVVMLTALRLAEAGKLDLDADVRNALPQLKHPDFAEAPLTLRLLLSHRSSLRDPVDEAYYAASPNRIETILGPHLAIRDRRPGSWFEYCNLNYGIAATLLERAAGDRFDRLARRLVLTPAGLSGGFNWSGVSARDRRAGATLYRRFEDGWRVQADGPAALAAAEPTGIVLPGFRFDDYAVGSNGTLFSPQGGLRLSARELAQLARLVGAEPELQAVTWRYAGDSSDRRNGEDGGGLFLEAGLGCFHWPADESPIPGQRMIGHDGEAYGLYSGAWYLPELDAAIGFAVTGTPAGEQPPGLRHRGYNRWSQACFDRAAQALGLAPDAAAGPEPAYRQRRRCR